MTLLCLERTTAVHIYVIRKTRSLNSLRLYCVVYSHCTVNLFRFFLFDGKPIGLTVLCFYSKTVFGPRTAKSQPIWIKFCTHLSLFGIHLWADVDRDRRVGGSRPNQNDYVNL